MTRSLRFGLLAVAALLFFGSSSIVELYTDWLWFGEVGLQPVFQTTVGAQVLLGSVAFVVSAVWLAFNLRLAVSSLRAAAPLLWTGQGVPIQLPSRETLQRLTYGAAVLLAIPAALVVSSQWMTWLAFRYAVPFNIADPVLGHDVGFYIFTLPFIDLVRGGAMALVIAAVVTSAVVYGLTGGVGVAPSGRLFVSPAAQRHLAWLAAMFFGLLAVGAWLDRPRLLIEPSGLVFGASYADVAARMPAAWCRLAAALIGVALSIAAVNRRLLLIAGAAGVYLAVSFGGEAVASAVQRFVVAPNEQARETQYMEYNIAATRAAFGLEHVEERELTGDAVLTRDDIVRNAATLRNIRLWDHRPLLDTFGQLQEIRPYYDFVSVDNDRYTIDGELRQVMLSARELNSQALPNRTWINEHLTFTHGYGLTLGPVNQVTQEGLPVLYIKDLPPASTVDLPVTQPSLYFGEVSNDYVFVHTTAKEFDYPKGEDNVTTSYTGRGGVPVESIFRKALFALRFKSQQIFFSSDITTNSRVLFNRQISERVRAIAPFLEYDGDPYLVVVGGRLVWIQDAYTTSDRYPYSTPGAEGINYIRNSVKVTVDAYDGTTLFYLADDHDPLVLTYQRMFPALFHPLSEMPAGIRSHVRYPEAMFGLQTAAYTTFHMTNPVVFYNKEDQWEIPQIDRQQTDRGDEGSSDKMEPYYTIMRLPGEKDDEFLQMVPLTPRRKDNLSAWMVARSDGAHYGHLLVFRFPKQKVVFGPRQVIARINQDQVISPQITLWNQQGSQVIQGTLLVIPIEESLLYVRPLYLRGQGGRIPELKRVIVAYQNAIVMEETLEAALDRLFAGTIQGLRVQTDVPGPGQKSANGTAPPTPSAAPPELADLAAQARSHYDRAIQAQRDGNWALYGDELKALGEVLQRMQAASGGKNR